MRTQPPATALLGAPVVTDLAQLDAEVAVLGVPHGVPYPMPGTTAGCVVAPAVIRERSQRLARFRGHWDFDLDGPMLPSDGSRLIDAGDVPGTPDDAAGNTERTTAAVRAILDAGAVPVCLGGDDSVPIPILRAWEGRDPLTVLQVDAHLDFRDEVQGVRDGYSSPMRRASEMSHVRRIVHVGLRGVGSARATDVEDSRRMGNLLVTAAELEARGVDWLLAQLADETAIFLALDLDGLDPSVVPAVSALAPGGIGWATIVPLVRGLAGRVAGAAVTELVPELDTDGRSAFAATRLVTLIVAAAGDRSAG
jgi:agmatinase